MSYNDSWIASQDYGFQGRILSCATEQAWIYKDDARPEFSVLANQIVASQENARVLIAPVCGRPGITTESSDGDILSAVQFVWPTVGATRVPVPPVES